jgi:uncharacterized protein (DUF885 family)
MIDIQRLRKMAEDQLGDKFDIKAFHDTVLGGGALPLDMLERQVKSWIAAIEEPVLKSRQPRSRQGKERE